MGDWRREPPADGESWVRVVLEGREIWMWDDVICLWMCIATVPDHLTVAEWEWLYGPEPATLEEVDRG
jgi:hypothetical protein